MSASQEEVVAKAKEDIQNCDKESAEIRAALRALGDDNNNNSATAESKDQDDKEEPNSLIIELEKIEGLPESAQPKLTLQLSSPIEEGVITNTEKQITFNAVETGQATLTIIANDADIPLGTSTSYDVSSFTYQLLDGLHPKTTYTYDLIVPIKAEEESADVICTIYFKLTYIPSKKDQREELYELLNGVTKRKAEARETWRKAETALAATKNTKPSSSSSKPAVSAGFLNKKKDTVAAQQPPKWKTYYNILKTTIPVVKNYIIFGTFCIFCHYRGQNLAIPAPV